MAAQKEGLLIIADSAKDADMLYATGMFVPDPFVHIRVGRRKIAVFSDLEIDRAKKTLAGFEIVPLSEVIKEISKNGKGMPSLAEVALAVLRRNGVRRVTVPGTFPLEFGDLLRKRGITVRTGGTPFFKARLTKSDAEVAKIREAQEATEAAMGAAVETIRRAEIRGDALYAGGAPLTSERVREVIAGALFARGCIAADTIVAGGLQGCDPHDMGSGPLPANAPIILDIFPRSSRTGYFGDMTRTVVRGRASEKVKRMFAAVLEGQEIAFRMIKAGVSGLKIHTAITKRFEQLGFPTGVIDGRMQGFFHGTGHALGLEIHEPPRISKVAATLRAGMVMTVEPGLYYTDAGGMRIEDVVVVRKDGCENLNRYPKELEVN
jgi:Xaa-Pro aminopeptidase